MADGVWNGVCSHGLLGATNNFLFCQLNRKRKKSNLIFLAHMSGSHGNLSPMGIRVNAAMKILFSLTLLNATYFQSYLPRGSILPPPEFNFSEASWWQNRQLFRLCKLKKPSLLFKQNLTWNDWSLELKSGPVWFEILQLKTWNQDMSRIEIRTGPDLKFSIDN